MKKVCVISGGASGMGFEAAKLLGKERILVISGIGEAQLNKAADELRKLNIEVHTKLCDVTSREDVKELVKFAFSFGEISIVINSAGLSPATGKIKDIVNVNVKGVIYINQEFPKVMSRGSAIVNVASVSAYQIPDIIVPTSAFKYADTNEELLVKRIIRRCVIIKNKPYLYSGMAYSITKNFVVWYSKEKAFELGSRGIRVVSISPGITSTKMGELEFKHQEGKMEVEYTCEKRMGTPEGLGFALASIADERNEYLTGTDVLVDGGTVTGILKTRRKFFSKL